MVERLHSRLESVIATWWKWGANRIGYGCWHFISRLGHSDEMLGSWKVEGAWWSSKQSIIKSMQRLASNILGLGFVTPPRGCLTSLLLVWLLSFFIAWVDLSLPICSIAELLRILYTKFLSPQAIESDGSSFASSPPHSNLGVLALYTKYGV